MQKQHKSFFIYKTVFLVFITLFIIGCKESSLAEKNKKYFNSNGKMDSIVSFIDSKRVVTIPVDENTIYYKFYNENGKISVEGKMIKKIITGFWKYYDKDGILEKKIEYKNIRGKQHTNQGIYYTKEGDTLKHPSNFLLVDYKDEIKINEIVNIDVTYVRALDQDNEIELVLSQDFNEDFSNTESVKKTSFKTGLDGFTFKMKYESAGKRIFRGYIKESIDNPDNKAEKLIRFVYFEMPFIVN